MSALRARSAALASALIWGASGALASETQVDLARRPDKTYEVAGSFTVDASTAIVWGALTDYDRIPAFVSSMRSSRVRATRGDGSLLVQQEAVIDLFFVSRTMSVLLEVRRSPDRIRFRDVGNESFTAYEGYWEVRRASAGVVVSYHLLAAPRAGAPSFIVGRAMKRGARKLLDEVRAEIVRRELSQ